jgi:hypothetical protein
LILLITNNEKIQALRCRSASLIIYIFLAQRDRTLERRLSKNQTCRHYTVEAKFLRTCCWNGRGHLQSWPRPCSPGIRKLFQLLKRRHVAFYWLDRCKGKAISLHNKNERPKITSQSLAISKTQEAKYIERWPNTTSACAGWRRFDIPVDMYGGVHSLLQCSSSTLGSPTSKQANRKILIEQNIKNRTGPAL